jgi:hypothetical protein
LREIREPIVPRQAFLRVVSLGGACRTKFNVLRYWHARETSFWATKTTMPNVVFDWQITPYPAVLDYLRRDFRGMFERADLVRSEGVVVNERYATRHPHDIPKSADIDERYPVARSRHDHLCDNARQAFRSPLPTLFVINGKLSEPQRETLRRTIVDIRGRHPFELSVIDDEDQQPTHPAKEWKGNKAFWNRELSRYRVVADEPLRVILPKILREQTARLAGHVGGGRSKPR